MDRNKTVYGNAGRRINLMMRMARAQGGGRGVTVMRCIAHNIHTSGAYQEINRLFQPDKQCVLKERERARGKIKRYMRFTT